MSVGVGLMMLRSHRPRHAGSFVRNNATWDSIFHLLSWRQRVRPRLRIIMLAVIHIENKKCLLAESHNSTRVRLEAQIWGLETNSGKLHFTLALDTSWPGTWNKWLERSLNHRPYLGHPTENSLKRKKKIETWEPELSAEANFFKKSGKGRKKDVTGWQCGRMKCYKSFTKSRINQLVSSQIVFIGAQELSPEENGNAFHNKCQDHLFRSDLFWLLYCFSK